MRIPKVLVVPGSLRSGSHNVRLAALVAKELALAGAEVNRVSLADYPMPIYDADLAREKGPPLNAVKLKRYMSAHHGVFIASPEYNASIPPLLKNAIDWVSDVREPGEPHLAAYQNRVFALGAASPRRFGGVQSLLALRQILAVGCGALVIPDQINIARADTAFDDMDQLKDAQSAAQLKNVVRRLMDYVHVLA
jgi:chromate reductase